MLQLTAMFLIGYRRKLSNWSCPYVCPQIHDVINIRPPSRVMIDILGQYLSERNSVRMWIYCKTHSKVVFSQNDVQEI
jgi:hypothetical protein